MLSGRAQKIGHFDSEFVLNQMPEYKLKQKELESLAQSYSKEVRSLYDQVESSDQTSELMRYC